MGFSERIDTILNGTELTVPKFKGDSSFSYFAARSWNSVPSHIRHAKTLDIFKSKLKSYHFTVHFTDYQILKQI